MLAVRMFDPSDWPPKVQGLMLSVSAPAWEAPVKGSAVVLGRIDDTLVCRYFPDVAVQGHQAALDDMVWVTLDPKALAFPPQAVSR